MATDTMSLEIHKAVFNGAYPCAIVLSCLPGLASLVIIVLRRSSRPALP